MSKAIGSMTAAQLLRQYANTLAALRERGVIRSANAPAGDYAEWLCAKALGGEISSNLAEKSFDLTLTSRKSVQVKARVVDDPPKPSQIQTSPFRSWGFDEAALVLFRSKDYRVEKAVLLPQAVVEQHSTWKAHINGSVLRMTPAILADPSATDITEELRAAAESA